MNRRILTNIWIKRVKTACPIETRIPDDKSIFLIFLPDKTGCSHIKVELELEI
jgi:hypothetical protein